MQLDAIRNRIVRMDLIGGPLRQATSSIDNAATQLAYMLMGRASQDWSAWKCLVLALVCCHSCTTMTQHKAELQGCSCGF